MNKTFLLAKPTTIQIAHTFTPSSNTSPAGFAPNAAVGFDVPLKVNHLLASFPFCTSCDFPTAAAPVDSNFSPSSAGSIHNHQQLDFSRGFTAHPVAQANKQEKVRRHNDDSTSVLRDFSVPAADQSVPANAWPLLFLTSQSAAVEIIKTENI